MENFKGQMNQKEEDELDIILNNYNSQDGSLSEYLEKLKEDDKTKYYRIIEKLANRESKEQMKEPTIANPKKEVKKSKEPEKPESPGGELYGRFNKFKKY